ncbi:hypothetical protein PPERSA_05119 [Pseudocohnilembus persalinus]|uniref:Uncharacterized protein n=1 Tax=Pseudocohnilembus persalinus TaxID=266149 RepID=A0A0V0QWS3_PSEPJ|nr:hypothetical protein PPERSA_05119 [Pseudocohnilembus persalinus]|eukprot:KRX06506.1 hypothetical protein PPERSA_05119 [Pseudocohnilembus persalinus]
MSMSTPFFPIFIKGFVWVGTSYLVYELYKIQKYEKKAQKIQALRDHRRKLGESVDDIEEPPEVKQFMDDHYGRKLMERMQTQYLIEDNIKYQIEQKKALREKLKEDVGDEQLNEIDGDIERLNNLFKQIKPEKKLAHPAQEFIHRRDNM